ncbi:MAG: fibronectin type III domain-containing protein [Desulfosarcinaceae bacterium]
MYKKILIRHFKLLSVIVYYLLIVSPLIVSAAQVSLQWDANDPAPDGYHVYQRSSGQSYDYGLAAWTGTATSCTVENLSEGVTYYFVVRAFAGTDNSGDSNEVSYTPAAIPPADSDGDGVNDALDAFPSDPDEWLDTDGDGIGNNGDQDDDGDGMTDLWEQQYGLDPLVDDADQDFDGDGLTNLEEFESGSDPSVNPLNQAPAAPIFDQPAYAAVTSLNPEIQLDGYSDNDGDAHVRTRYQIGADAAFTNLVFDRTSSVHLTNMTMPDLILDPDTTYYLRARFIDDRNGESEWSETLMFLTTDYSSAGDSNADGVPDEQELTSYADLDGDGINDQGQAGIITLNAPDAINPQVAVERQSPGVQVVAARAYGDDGLGLASSLPASMTGLVCFKLYLDSGVTMASVTVYLSAPAPVGGTWYKYDLEEGWYAYPQAVFSADRRSVSLIIEDGGVGDQDGVRNGVIVDPAGLAYTSASGGGSVASSTDSTSNGGCFIGASRDGALNGDNPLTAAVLIIGGLLGGLALCERLGRIK